MTKSKVAGIAVLRAEDIPSGFAPMSDYARRGEQIYSAVKKAALSGKVESYCLFEGGRMRARPRRWVLPAEVEAKVLRRLEAPLFPAAASQQATPAGNDSAAVVVEALRMLTLEVASLTGAVLSAVEALRPAEVEPATFGAD